MAIKWKHDDNPLFYFCTFTCYQWLSLFEIVNGYDLVYNWFDILKSKNHQTVAFVIMPNHVHTIHYFPEPRYNLNMLIGNGKRFIAYEIVNRLQLSGRQDLLKILSGGLAERDIRKGQQHKVFTDSFDAKGIHTDKFFNQKLNYIHLNPVRGIWKLVDDFTEYAHSSASYYEHGIVRSYQPFDFRNI